MNTARLFLISMLGVAACGDAVGPHVASVLVTAPATTIEVRQAVQLSAQALDRDHAPVHGRSVEWSSGNAVVATVDGAGLVTAVSPGTVTITATVQGTSGSVALTIVPIPVGAITVIPESTVLEFPGTIQLAAIITSASGDTLTNQPITWLSSSHEVATVGAAGFVTARGGGTATIFATSGTKHGTAKITVTVSVALVGVIPDSATLPVGSTTAFQAVLIGRTGDTLAGRPVEWSSSSPEIATVNATGLVTVWSAGSTTITAMSEGKSGAASITVVPCVAMVSVRTLDPALPRAGTLPPRTFVRVHGDVVRGTAPPRTAARASVPFPSPAEAGCPPLEPRAWTGQSGPEGGSLEPVASVNPAVFAGNGRLAFMAYLNGLVRNQGVFVAENGGVRAVAIGCGGYAGTGQPGSCGDPTPLGGTFAGFFGGTWLAPAANDAGDVLFLADLYGAGTPRALFLYRAGGDSIVTVAAVGDPSPAGGVLTAVGPGSIDGQGNVVFIALGATPDDHQVLHWSDGVLTTIVHTGDPAPDGDTWTVLVDEVLGFLDGTSIPVGPVPDIDDDGRVAFLGRAGASYGVAVWQNGTASWYVRDGDPTPTDATFRGFSAAILGGDGDVTFLAEIAVPNCCISGWFAGRPGQWRKVLAHFDAVDGSPVMGLALSRNPMQPITADGNVVVWVTVQLPDSSYREQLVLVRRDGTYESIAYQGQPATPSGFLDIFNPWISIDALGRATVSAATPGGVGSSAHFVQGP